MGSSWWDAHALAWLITNRATSQQKSTTRGCLPLAACQGVVELSSPAAVAAPPCPCAARDAGQLPTSRGFPPPGGGQRSCRRATRRVVGLTPFLFSRSPVRESRGTVKTHCLSAAVPSLCVHHRRAANLQDEVLPHHRYTQIIAYKGYINGHIINQVAEKTAEKAKIFM